MRKARQNGFERIENYLVKLIQEKGADRDQPGAVNFLLAILKGLSYVFAAAVGIRYLLYGWGLLRRYPSICRAGRNWRSPPAVIRFRRRRSWAGGKA